MGNPSHKYRWDIAACIAYLFLAILFTYPLILHFATHVPGDGSDDPALAWNLWWVPYSILNLQRSPIYTDYMFYPIGINLAYYTLTYLNAFLSIPFQFAFNLVVAANVNLLLSFTLSGFGTYLLVKWLVREWTVDSGQWSVELSAFVAGALYAFSSNKMLYASLGQFNIASSHWIPFYILFLLKLFPIPNLSASETVISGEQSDREISIVESQISRSARNDMAVQPPRNPKSLTLAPHASAGVSNLHLGLLLGLFLVFQALSEFIFASFLIIFTALYVAYWLIRRRRKIERGSILGLIVAVVVFTILMSPILTAMIADMRVEGDFMQSGLGFADTFSSDLLGFFVPSHLHPLFRGLESQFHFAYTNFAYLGFIALALAFVALWKSRGARLWGAFGAIFVLISLGPVLQINGRAFDLPLPFNLLLDIPFVKGNRYPSRWSVMVTLCLAVLVGYGVMWISQKAKSKRQKEEQTNMPQFSRIFAGFAPPLLPFAFLLLILFEHLSVLPLSNMQVPAVYGTIAQDRGDFSVLEIPLAWRNGFRMTGTLDSAMMFAQWYQTVQRHPILGGNTSRNPELKFQYFTEAPVINSLIAVETGSTLDVATLARDRELAGPVLGFFGVRYVVWHSPRDPANRRALDDARAYVEQVLPVTKFYDQVDETGETVAYRVNENRFALPSIVRSDDPMARLFFAEGWGTVGGSAVWATRNEATFLIPKEDLATPDTTLSFRLYAPMQNQTAQVMLDDQAVGSLTLRQGWGEYAIPVSDKVWQAGVNRVSLRFGQLVPTAAVREGDWAIGKTGVTAPASIVVRSAGSEVGDFGHIYVNGEDVSPNRRGYNIVVMDASSGRVDASAVFDTFDSETQSARLAEFIAEIPSGKIVAVAARDEISRRLTPEVTAAFRSIGATQDMLKKWRWSHAILGVKGAPPASALEASSETMPTQIVVGVGSMEPNIAAAIEWVRIGK